MNDLMITSWDLVITEPDLSRKLRFIEDWSQEPEVFVIQLIELFEEAEAFPREMVIHAN